jgi:3',5'-cyclic AMP phosphodiesterase CpdA
MRINVIVWWIIFQIWSGAAQAQSLDVHPVLPSSLPDRIVLTAAEDLTRGASVTFRTALSVERAFAEIAIADPHPLFFQQAQKITAERQEVRTEGLYASYFSVSFKDLVPNTVYAYRVGQGNHWSEWFQFKTASDASEFTFLYFGDVQTNILPLWSRTIRQAYKQVPDASAVLYAGDLVNRGNRDVEWGDWFAAGNFIHASIPVIPTPGNHDHGDDEKGKYSISKFWKAQFELPKNGPKDAVDVSESCYFVDAQDVRIITINTELFEEYKAVKKAQLAWLEDVLANNPKKWTVLLMHHPIYSTKRNRDNVDLRKAIKPLLDQYKVDLVLQGHDHTYVRGMEKVPMEKGQSPGTAYVVSVSGPKMSEVLRADWMDRTAGFTQLFHAVHVKGDQLIFKTYTSSGQLYDEFELHKQAGTVNRFLDKAPKNVPERH